MLFHPPIRRSLSPFCLPVRTSLTARGRRISALAALCPLPFAPPYSLGVADFGQRPDPLFARKRSADRLKRLKLLPQPRPAFAGRV